MQRSTPADRLLVLYDAGCGFCIWVIALFLRLDHRRVLVPATTQSHADTALRDIPRDRVLQSFHAITADGRVLSAGAALAAVLETLPGLRRAGRALRSSPQTAERLYRLVAGHRAQLAHVLPESAKAYARVVVAERERLAGAKAGPVPRAEPMPEPARPDDGPTPGPTAGSPEPAPGELRPDPVAVRTQPAPVSPAELPSRVEPLVPAASAVPEAARQPEAYCAAGAPAAPEPAPADTSLRAAVRLVGRHVRPLRLKLAAGMLLLVLASVVGLGQPLATRWVLDTIAAQGPMARAVAVLMALVFGAAACQGAGQYLMLRSAEDVVMSSRRRLVDRMLELSVPSMRSQEPGDLMARVTSDTALIRQIALQSLVQMVTGGVVVIGAVGVMLWLDPFLFAVTFAVVAVLGLLLGLILPRIKHSSRETQRNVGAMASELERVLGAYTTVKAAGAEELESERLGEKVRRAHDSGVRTALWNALAGMTSVLAVQAAFLVVLGVGGSRVQQGALSVATLIAFLLYAMQLSTPVLQLTQAVTSFQAGRAALERISAVDDLDREAHPALPDTPDSPLVPGSLAALTAVSWNPAAAMDAVVFRYPGTDAPALCGVSFTVPERGVTAIVGPSGSGKSSVLKLLEGFYPLEAGRVCVGGRSLAEWDLAELRDCVAYVEQETPVFAGTLLDNLTYGTDDVSDGEVLAAVQDAGLEERIPSLDDARAQVGHRGGSLSGGERQRLAIARALLRSPKLLLLDEATSQLDAANEARLRDLVEGLGREMAVVLVAHRLASVVGADQVLVMDGGRVRARGTHEELLDKDELYRCLVEEQQQLMAVAGSAPIRT